MPNLREVVLSYTIDSSKLEEEKAMVDQTIALYEKQGFKLLDRKLLNNPYHNGGDRLVYVKLRR